MTDVQLTHRLYIDDSGTKEYAVREGDYGSGNTRYFVFGGLLVPVGVARQLALELQTLKAEHFGTRDVEVKSNWLRMPRERERRYLARHGLTEEELRRFVDRYYQVLDAAEIQFIAGVIDKVEMRREYEKAWYPPAAAYELVLQRVEDELRGAGTFSVVVDDMTGATPKRNQYKQNLINQHGQMRKRGSQLLKGFAYTSLRGDLKFVNSARSELIQVADVAAYNVFRQFQDHGEFWERPAEQLPTYEYFDRVANKFRMDRNGRVQGYGVVKLPRRGRVPWAVTPRNEK